jgi:endonuclease YncB( thermonuclease family)
MRTPTPPTFARVLLLLGLTWLGAAYAGSDADVDPEAPPKPTGPVVPGPATATVTSVYDGDTFTLSTGDRVRVKWVNTPELKPPEPYGIEARDATTAFVRGKTVSLVYGPAVRDGYNRLIAGVTVDGKSLEEHLLEMGLGHLFVIPPDDTDLSGFIAAQERARTARRGIWSDPRYQGVLHITSFHANADGDDRENVNGEYLRVCNVSPKPLDLSGFRITDINGNSWEFPAIVMPAGHTVKVHSGQGPNQADPQAQLEIHLGSAGPIWNNKADRATIYDRFGREVDHRVHEVQTETP